MTIVSARGHATLATATLLLLPSLFGITSGLLQFPPSAFGFKGPISYRYQTPCGLASVVTTDDETADLSKDDEQPITYDWDEQFEELQKFKTEYGHCNFPQNPSVELKQKYPMLKRFCQDQRRENKRLQENARRFERMNLPGFDRKIRCRRLEELGFEFNPKAAQWYDNYHEMVMHSGENGHFNNMESTDPLYKWTSRQQRRRAGKKGLVPLVDEQIGLLEKINVPLEGYRHDSMWFEMYHELKRFHKEHGHFQPERSTHRRLYDWVWGQKVRYQKGRLSTEKIDLLNEVDFSWERRKVSEWPKMLNELTEYYRAHGHIQVSQEEDPELYDWMDLQRKRYHDSRKTVKLSDEQIEQLEDLHFCWSLEWRDRTWHEKYTEAVEYFKEHGHIRVTSKENPSLYNWIQTQEKRFKGMKGQKPLSDEELEMLEGIEFSFLDGQPRMAWNDMYARVTKYRDANSGQLPTSHKDDPNLSRWLRHQLYRYRSAYGYAPLSDEQKSLLQSIDLSMYPKGQHARQWYEMYDELVEFGNQHGNFVVDRSEFPALYSWSTRQRNRYNRTNVRETPLSKLQVYLLERIGFSWTSDRYDVEWQQRFDELVEFLETQNHFPTKADNKRLYYWTVNQRSRYKGITTGAELSHDQIQQLEKIGFKW